MSKLDRAPVLEQTRGRGIRYRFGSEVFYDEQIDVYVRETALGREYADRIFELEGRVDSRRRRIESLARVLASPSPAFLMTQIAASYAGTSVDDYNRYLEDCRQLRLSFVDYLTGRGAFSSWRWFTDDPRQDLEPWPEFLGATTAITDETVIAQLVQQFAEGAAERPLLLAKSAHAHDPNRRLVVNDLPVLQRTKPGIWQASRRVTAEVLLILLMNAILACAVGWRFAGYSPT